MKVPGTIEAFDEFNWDEWNVEWADSVREVGNDMWAKVRSGENDPVTGEPLFRYADKGSDEVEVDGGGDSAGKRSARSSKKPSE